MLGFLHPLENPSHDLYRRILTHSSIFVILEMILPHPPLEKEGLFSSFERQGADGANFDAFAALGAS